MGIFERYLSLWVGLSILLGVLLGLWQPTLFQMIANLEIAHVISLFGLHSGAAIATVVGVLVEVPILLSLVAFINRTQHWFR